MCYVPGAKAEWQAEGMNDAAIRDLSLAAMARAIRSGGLSPVELTGAHLESIAGSGPFAIAYLEVFADEARAGSAQAETEIERGEYRGPLHGVPVALKDLCDVAGRRTTAGSLVLDDAPKDADSEVARRLRAAGAVILGKTNLHEFAFGPSSVNPHYGTPPNPWDPKRVPGGSSGGSGVAVGLGMAAGAIGSDTGGSIRVPAAHCGITGLKPSFGLVSRRGVWPLSMTLDHVGPMARSAMDCALLLSVLAGYDPGDPYSEDRPPQDYTASIGAGIRGRRIGVPVNFFFDDLEPDVERLVRWGIEELRSLGAEIVEIEMPWAKSPLGAGRRLVPVEAAWIHRRHLADPEIMRRIGKDVAELMRRGVGVEASDYYGWLDRRMEIARLADELLQTVDLVVTPTAHRTAGLIAETETIAYHSVLAFTRVFDITHQPSISVPCGFDAGGLPVGLMLSGRRWNDALVLRAAYAYQEATDWHQRRPPAF
jgi:aspartyl-tRNA(Asn)/glutamyl-tRNA(Gln) amidotransferase subunit A